MEMISCTLLTKVLHAEERLCRQHHQGFENWFCMFVNILVCVDRRFGTLSRADKIDYLLHRPWESAAQALVHMHNLILVRTPMDVRATP